jgi:hypothetical protein
MSALLGKGDQAFLERVKPGDEMRAKCVHYLVNR